MAGFQTKNFLKHDDYMTPKYAWENIQHLIPRDKVIWEAFYGDGESGIEVYELDSKYYVYSFDVGGSLGGEEVFDNLEEVEEEVLPSITELTYSVGYVNRKYKWVEFK